MEHKNEKIIGIIKESKKYMQKNVYDMQLTDCTPSLAREDITVMEGVKQMNSNSMQILLIVDESKTLLGVVTDGDVRRALIENINFSSPIREIMNSNPTILTFPIEKKKALKTMKKLGIRHLPVVDNENKVSGLILWKDLFINGDIPINKKKNFIVIMAGGKGTRLDLFTKILPKPLIPIGEKPIIEHIIDKFYLYGFDNFLISLNYKADMIKTYFSDNHHNYAISYVQESDYLGTAGALSLCSNIIDDTFIVSNCDVIVDCNLDQLFNYHKKNSNHATILGSVQNVKIPYGVLHSDCQNLENIVEKPEYNFLINTGIYVLEPELIKLLPHNQPMDMPSLLLRAKEKGFKVQIFPMTCSWFDVGQWNEYKKALDYMTSLGANN